jgi:hypothetical protein
MGAVNRDGLLAQITEALNQQRTPNAVGELDPQIAYAYPALAAAVDLSVQTLRDEVKAGRLIPSYVGAKPLFRYEEVKRWLESLPAERL